MTRGPIAGSWLGVFAQVEWAYWGFSGRWEEEVFSRYCRLKAVLIPGGGRLTGQLPVPCCSPARCPSWSSGVSYRAATTP